MVKPLSVDIIGSLIYVIIEIDEIYLEFNEIKCTFAWNLLITIIGYHYWFSNLCCG